MDEEEWKKRSGERVSDVRVHGRPRSTQIYVYMYVPYIPGHCTERPKATFLGALSWKLSFITSYHKYESFGRAYRGSLRTYFELML